MRFRAGPPGLIQHVPTVLVFWSWVLLLHQLPPSFRSLRLLRWPSILLHGPLDICLDVVSAAPLPPVQKREALVTRPKYPPYCETGVAIPLSHCVFCGIAGYRCYTPTSFRKSGLSQSKDRPNKGGITEEACP